MDFKMEKIVRIIFRVESENIKKLLEAITELNKKGIIIRDEVELIENVD